MTKSEFIKLVRERQFTHEAWDFQRVCKGKWIMTCSTRGCCDDYFNDLKELWRRINPVTINGEI